MIGIIVRPMVREDRAYAVSTWYSSAREAWHRWGHRGAECFAGVPVETFDAGARILTRTAMNAILDRVTSLAAVACPEDDHDTILGWAVAQPGVVHWVHVRHSARRSGLGRMLMDAVQPGWAERPPRMTYLSHAWPAWRARGAVWDPTAGREVRHDPVAVG